MSVRQRVLLMLGSNESTDRIVQQAMSQLSGLGELERVGKVAHLPPRSGQGAWFFNALVTLEADMSEASLRAALRQIEQSLGRNRDTPLQVAIDIDVLARFDGVWQADSHAFAKGDVQQWPASQLLADCGLVVRLPDGNSTIQ